MTEKPKRERASQAPKKLPGGVSMQQQNWKHDFAARHGISQPLLDPDPKPPAHSVRGD